VYVILSIALGLAIAVAAVAATGWWRARARERDLRRKVDKLRTRYLALENQLLQARRMEAVGILAGSLVHNLNNLFAVILGHARMGAQSLPEDHPVREEFAKVMKAGSLAGELVSEVSDLYRRADRARKPTDLEPVVRDTLKLLRDILPATVEIREDLQSVGPVLVSSTGVQQVLMNLASNAVGALRAEQGVIEVTLREAQITSVEHAVPRDLEPGRYALLSIRDDGRGMDEETVNRIFESYFSEAAEKSQMGIGLSTVCRILRAHDGATVPVSTPGSGTRFDIYFPMIAWAASTDTVPPMASVPEAVPFVESTPADASEDTAAGHRVLVVDDDEMVAHVLGAGLRRLGCRVAVHTDARDALAEFARAPDDVDVVVTDQIMPHMSGVRLTRRLHDIRPAVPVILCTGFRDSFNEQQAREAGVSEFLLKPGSHRDLLAMIHRVAPRAREGRA
jgi:signal transduction histidine kinase/ActR/RegA family two-component response regulator